jgi:hypothetical protein
MSKLIVWRFLTSNLRTNKADIKEINLKLIKVTPSYGNLRTFSKGDLDRYSTRLGTETISINLLVIKLMLYLMTTLWRGPRSGTCPR